jgi:2-aminobenzoate-CoA ligase
LVPGNRVLLHAANTPLLLASWLATMRAGMIGVTTAPMLGAQELREIGHIAQVSLALVQDDLSSAVRSAGMPHTVEFSELSQRAAVKDIAFGDVDTASDDVALLAFTSGTTGVAKATMHFHRDVLTIADTFSAQVLRPNADDIFTGSPPLGFTFGLGALLVFPMRVGAATLLLERPTSEAMAEAISEFGATVLFTAPTAYRKMVGETDRTATLRTCVSAGEPLTLDTFDAWRDATGISIVDGIGATELLHVFAASRPNATRRGAIGPAVPGFEVTVLDDDLRPVRPGDDGRLAVRGPTGCRYLGGGERQRAYVQGGWNLTGDICTRDEDGYLRYVARSDDMIITAGHNVAPAEVEATLLAHPDVVECGVVGTPDIDRTMLIKAYVVLDSAVTSSDPIPRLLAHCRNSIARYKVPHDIQIVRALPRSATGKIQRQRLRRLATGEGNHSSPSERNAAG